ncbi:MAG: hypothetical protein ACPGVV_01090 [Croceimicrobium sp.]
MSLKRLIIRGIGLLLFLGFLALAGGYFWAKQKYPAYAKDFYISNKWFPSEEKVLAQVEIANWANHRYAPKTRHRVLRFNQSDDWEIPAQLFQGIKEGESLILSLECWGSKYWPVYRSQPLQSIKDGAYDLKLQKLAQALAALNYPVYLRFNPQMEVPGRYYPWQEYPSIYIDAYRHVHQQIKNTAPKTKMLWGPSGYPGLEEFYPGRNYVDALSINLIGDSESILSVYPKNNPKQELYRRLHRLRFFNHPCFILSGSHNSINKMKLKELARYQQENRPIYGERLWQYPEEKQVEDSIFKLGVYDPDEKLVALEALNVEHLFTNITSLIEEKLPEQVAAVQARGHDVIVTLELHNDSNNLREEAGLEKLLAGSYDPCLAQLCSILDSFPHQVYLRFSQEMEIPIERYPWQSKDPKLYIDAYRYCMNYVDTALKDVKMVWGPAGDRGSLEWYPGDDLVDYISIAIYGLPDKNITDPTKQESFAQIYKRKSWRMRQAPKAIFITEFGVKGPEDYQKQWLLKAAETINSAPELIGINYFNMHDVPKAWGDIEPPNWSVEQATYRNFLSAIQAKH